MRYSITNPDAYVESNLVGFFNILEACRHSYDDGQSGVEHLVYDWMFTITVSKISEVQEDFEPRVIKSKGTVQQYPDWDEEDFDEE